MKIPAGIEHEMRLRVSGEGEAGEVDGANGDLYVEVHVKEHPVFTRKENDIQITIPISFSQAVLGDDIEIPTIDGKATLKIPAGTQSETILRMRDKGLPFVNGTHKGDQMVKVRIEVPKKLNKKQLELVKQLDEEKPIKGFVERMFGR